MFVSFTHYLTRCCEDARFNCCAGYSRVSDAPNRNTKIALTHPRKSPDPQSPPNSPPEQPVVAAPPYIHTEVVGQIMNEMTSSCSNANDLLSFLFLWVKSEYVNLKETLGAVTQERDLALLERNQLQGKLENLEQVLKVRNTVLIVRQYRSATLPSSVAGGGLTKSGGGVDARSSLHPPDPSLPFSSRFTV